MDIAGDVGVGASRSLRTHNEKTGIIVNISLFQTLEINQRLAILQEAFIQEKRLPLGKNGGPCGILARLF